MGFIIFVVVLFLSFMLGTFGFAQVIGTLKYWRNFKLGSAIFTIVLWIIILGLAAMAVIAWLSDYIFGLVLGYIISFCLSLNTKPDADTPVRSNSVKSNNVVYITDDDCDKDISYMFSEDKRDIESINKAISTMIETYNDGIRNLGDYTLEDAELAYKYKQINNEQYIELKNAIEKLTFMKETYPSMINEMKEKRKEIFRKYE